MMKGNLEELGEEVDDSVDSISKVQTQILNLTKGKVNIFDQNKNFRDYYEIMKDIAAQWDDMASTDQANLTEILFGKNRANQGLAMIQAFQSGQIEKAYDVAMKSEGSAKEEQARWMDSIEAKSQQLKASFQDLSQTLLSSDIAKFFLDIGTNGVSALDSLLEKLGSFKTIFSAISGVLMTKTGNGLTLRLYRSLRAYLRLIVHNAAQFYGEMEAVVVHPTPHCLEFYSNK